MGSALLRPRGPGALRQAPMERIQVELRAQGDAQQAIDEALERLRGAPELPETIGGYFEHWHIVEVGVLGFVLSEHPTNLTLPELSLAMNRDREGFTFDDEVEQAVRELVGAGLLRIVAGLVVPTRAALYFDTLGVD